MPDPWAWIIVAGPAVGALTAVVSIWLGFRAKKRQLEQARRALETSVADLGTRQQELLVRVQDLEAIVAAQAWDLLLDQGPGTAGRGRGAAHLQKIEQLARRLQVSVVSPVDLVVTAVSEWFRLRPKRRRRGHADLGLETSVATLESREKELFERVQHLEAIVASQIWDVLQDHGLSAADRERKLASVRWRELRSPDPDVANRQRIEQLARRLQS
jgi:hypothetical protein